eukprot:1891661-Pleurochrysis_carterae.AAC.2
MFSPTMSSDERPLAGHSIAHRPSPISNRFQPCSLLPMMLPFSVMVPPPAASAAFHSTALGVGCCPTAPASVAHVRMCLAAALWIVCPCPDPQMDASRRAAIRKAFAQPSVSCE